MSTSSPIAKAEGCILESARCFRCNFFPRKLIRCIFIYRCNRWSSMVLGDCLRVIPPVWSQGLWHFHYSRLPSYELASGIPNLSRCTILSSFDLISQFCFFQFSPCYITAEFCLNRPNTFGLIPWFNCLLNFLYQFCSIYCTLDPPGFQFKILGHKTNSTSETKFGYEHIWSFINSPASSSNIMMKISQ